MIPWTMARTTICKESMRPDRRHAATRAYVSREWQGRNAPRALSDRQGVNCRAAAAVNMAHAGRWPCLRRASGLAFRAGALQNVVSAALNRQPSNGEAYGSRDESFRSY